jgi:hypothetical protein
MHGLAAVNSLGAATPARPERGATGRFGGARECPPALRLGEAEASSAAITMPFPENAREFTQCQLRKSCDIGSFTDSDNVAKLK